MISRKDMLNLVKATALTTAMAGGMTGVATAGQNSPGMYSSPARLAVVARREAVMSEGHAAVTEALLTFMKVRNVNAGAISFNPEELNKLSTWAEKHPGYAISEFNVSGERVAFAVPLNGQRTAQDAVLSSLQSGSGAALDTSQISATQYEATGITPKLLGGAFYQLDPSQVEDIRSQVASEDQRIQDNQHVTQAVNGQIRNVENSLWNRTSPQDIFKNLFNNGVQSIINHGR